MGSKAVNELNYCCACKKDFSSLSAFDKHRAGVHEYTFLQGIHLDPPKENGRRCLDEDEFSKVGLFLNEKGRWSLPSDASDYFEAPSPKTSASSASSGDEASPSPQTEEQRVVSGETLVSPVF
jgi:hypothetical protein